MFFNGWLHPVRLHIQQVKNRDPAADCSVLLQAYQHLCERICCNLTFSGSDCVADSSHARKRQNPVVLHCPHVNATAFACYAISHAAGIIILASTVQEQREGSTQC